MLDTVFHILCVHLGLDLQLKDVFAGKEELSIARIFHDTRLNTYKIEELYGFVAGCDNDIITNNENTQESLYTFFFWNFEWLVSYVTHTAYISIKYLLCDFYLYFNYHVSSLFFDVNVLENIYNVSNDALLYSIYVDQNLYGNGVVAGNEWITVSSPILGWYSPIFLDHPEINELISSSSIGHYVDYFTPFFLSFFNSKTFAVIETVTMTLTNLMGVLYIWILIKIFVFPFFFSASNSENVVDADHAVSTMLCECEKEIAAIDDLIIIFLVLIFIFGIYFLINGFVQLLHFVNNFVLVFLILPLFFFFVYVAPICLLFDFGIYCFMYLRGSGPTSTLAAELMYDLINLFAYYIRVCIQIARILLMLIAGGSLQEFIFYFGMDYKLMVGNESFLEDVSNIEFNLKSISFFFFTKLPMFLIYWVYEIFHTYFVVTIQTIAFFAMLFWLFFYLFTFFFSESQEKYFAKRRKLLTIFFEINNK